MEDLSLNIQKCTGLYPWIVSVPVIWWMLKGWSQVQVDASTLSLRFILVKKRLIFDTKVCLLHTRDCESHLCENRQKYGLAAIIMNFPHRWITLWNSRGSYTFGETRDWRDYLSEKIMLLLLHWNHWDSPHWLCAENRSSQVSAWAQRQTGQNVGNMYSIQDWDSSLFLLYNSKCK